MLSLTIITLASAALAAPLTQRSSNGPVISTNFQDPAVLSVDGRYFAFAGPNGNPAVNVITATSADFSNWDVNDADALPNPGAWTAAVPHVWAPDVVQLANDKFVLYYAAVTAQDTNKHCVGVATSFSPQGPFTAADSPLYCDLTSGGAIDPDGFKDPVTGNQYVVYKVDGNSLGHGGACANSVDPIVPTPLILQQVSPDDGISPIGAGITILSNGPEDGSSIEAPTIAYDAGTQQYVLFFTSGCFTTSSYSIQYATASSVAGPYTRKGLFLETGDTAAAVYIPGGPDVDPNTNKMVFHGDLNLGWFQGDGSKRVRGMYAATINWSPVSIGNLA